MAIIAKAAAAARTSQYFQITLIVRSYGSNAAKV
jgi:hypothetical protein